MRRQGTSARIAAVVPVGYLDRMGYQHTWAQCYENLYKSVDSIFLVDSVDQDLFANYYNYFSDTDTWFARKPDGSFWFDAYRVMENVNLGTEAARYEHDAAIVLMCNNYIDNADLLYEQAERMLVKDQPWNWYYRADQLGSTLFGPSVRLPWLVNLRHRADMRFSVDCLVCNGDIIRMGRGDYREQPLVVDVQLEMTREDLAEKMNFIRCYADLVPKRSPVFDWGYWFPYYVNKFKQKRRVAPYFSPTGEAIAANSRLDFVSHAVLEALA